MARVLVCGHINHDRLWRLDQPLRAGGRIGWLDREIRLGGGAFFTGAQLMALGHEVALVSSLGADQPGRQARARLMAEGYDTTHLAEPGHETVLTEILLEPCGERTILASRSAMGPLIDLAGDEQADAAYLNCLHPGPRLLEGLAGTGLVVSQFPLADHAGPRVADVMIGSCGDFPGVSMDALWRRAGGFCAGRLRWLVLTDGPGPVTILDGQAVQTVQPPRQVPASDTTGAGDTYAAGLIAALLKDQPIRDAVLTACRTTADWLEARDTGEKVL